MLVSEKKLLKKFKNIINISNRVSRIEVADSLGISEEKLFELLIKWGKILPFKIDKKFIIVDNIDAFLRALDKQFLIWDKNVHNSGPQDKILPINSNKLEDNLNKKNDIFYKKEKAIKLFANISDNISLKKPLLCTIEKVAHYNEERSYMALIIQDEANKRILGFIYSDLVKILNKERSKAKLPIQLTIFKCKLKTIGKKKQLEIYHAIINNKTYINSSWIGSHDYCKMQTYLNSYIHTISDTNENLLWGNLLHDYLSNIFSSSNLNNSYRENDKLKTLVITMFLKACYKNWRSFTTLEKTIKSVLLEFKNNFLLNEMGFIKNEFNYYLKEFGEFKFISEKMIYSKYLGIQGRIDRIVEKIPNSKFNIIETKTGKHPQSSIKTAYYQSMAYATILEEFYPSTLENIFIEFPRLPVNERMVSRDYNSTELLKVLKIRNEIWSIMIGNQPKRDEFSPCSRCSAANACDFYSYRNKDFSYCENIRENNIFYKYFEKDATKKAMFKRLNAYISWFYSLLDGEYFKNLSIINKIHLNAKSRELKGNCISDLEINLIDKNKQRKNYIKIISFSKKNRKLIKNTSLRKGDYIIITPQDSQPLASESERGNILKISTNEVIVEISRILKKEDSFLQNSLYRIDLTTSNYMTSLQKGIIDKFSRLSISPEYPHIKKLRNLLLFIENPKLDHRKKEKNQLKVLFEKDSKFDESQKKAIMTALNSKDMNLIQGPPGSGKTTIIIEIINRLVSKFLTDNKKNNNRVSNKKTLDLYLNNKQKYIKKIRPVLISAFTNKAVDNILIRLMEKYPDIKVVRLGNISSTEDPNIIDIFIDNLCSFKITYPSGEVEKVINPTKVRRIMENVDVIATTTTSAGNALLRNFRFETVILDEAGQIVESSALIPLLMGNHFVLVGDHQQLPPISIEQENVVPDETKKFIDQLHFDPVKGLGLSIFERLAIELKNSTNFVLLSKQYRMNRIISEFISTNFYEGKLEPGNIMGIDVGLQSLMDFFTEFNLENFNYSESETFGKYYNPKYPMVFLDTIDIIDAKDSSQFEESEDLESKFNEFEAQIVIKLIGYFIKEILIHFKNSGDFKELYSIIEKVGIISGYRAQNQKILKGLRLYLENLEIEGNFPLTLEKIEKILEILIVDTVDRFQGQEREIIIYNFVDSNSKYDLHMINKEIRRLNVAISRAKKKIIFIGNSPTLTKTKTEKETEKERDSKMEAKEIIKRLIEYIKIHNGYFVL